MRFVERDVNGKVKGIYAQRQPGYAEEELADDHPDVVAFLAPKLLAPQATLEDVIAVLPASQKAALEARVAAKGAR